VNEHVIGILTMSHQAILQQLPEVMMMSMMCLLLWNLTGLPLLVFDESGNSADSTSITTSLEEAEVRVAIQKAIPSLEQGSAKSADERKCFTCHNQALPVMALTEAAKRGFTVDQENLRRQIQHSWDHLQRGKSDYLAAKGQGGQVMTAGYAMWTLEAGEWKVDEVTSAVSHYLTEYQKDKGHWSSSSQRLPSAGSSFTASYVALRALSYYGNQEHSQGIEIRRDVAAKWILETEPLNTEDRVFQLLSLPYIEAGNDVVQKSVDGLLSRQREDGGWSQTDEMSSDAYATATVVTALQQAGGLAADHSAIVSGCHYLIQSQLPDGTWHVVTHAKPIQVYYESGFPHGKDQFISITATSWATLALVETLPQPVDK
jgi:hypothetical protein